MKDMEKMIKYCGFDVKVGCDEKCNKAWGISDRPFIKLSKDPYLVMSQLRHADLKVTLRYLRSLGQMVDDKIKNANIEM